MASLTKVQSATPWSDLQARLAGRGVVGVDAPPLKKPVAPPRLPAPTLRKEMFRLAWTKVSKAEKYVLEESGDAEFKSPGKVVYQGPETSWVDLAAVLSKPSLTDFALTTPSKYYRVKAIGKGGAGESGWSNIVTSKSESGWSNIATLATAKPVAPPRPPATTLRKAFFGLTWTEVRKAEKYVLEESGDAEFKHPGKVVYQGPRTSWVNLPPKPLRPASLTDFVLTTPVKYYRVKAIGKGAAGESGWSNIVDDPP